MNIDVYNHLKKHTSKDPYLIDRLIISAYFYINSLKVQRNSLLVSYLIQESSTTIEKQDVSDLIEVMIKSGENFNFEHLIELFEFVISPSDKIVNGAVYTPSYIRLFILEKLLFDSSGEKNKLLGCDPSCGCGGFLLTFSKLIKRDTGLSFYEIYKHQVYGVDITEYSITRSKLLLSLQALEAGEDVDFVFNIRLANSLSFNFRSFDKKVLKNNGFDLIFGNPPYVASRNMDVETLRLSRKWSVANSGHPDLYIPFFQIGFENLSPIGLLGFITVNTFIKSVNGRALRTYFQENDVNLTVLNFGGEQLFKDRNTYTCICFLKSGKGAVDYLRIVSNDLNDFNFDSTNHFEYSDLDNTDGWNLVNSDKLSEYINIIEKTGKQFKEIYNTKNGIATLKNNIYKFKPFKEDDQFYYLKCNNKLFPIERNICRNIINANKIKCEEDINRLMEKIIFPYDLAIKIYTEEQMEDKFPLAYQYLRFRKKELAKRDKGKREYEKWYAFGRRQSMDIHAYKLFFPHICERPTFVICEDQDLLFYNGMAIISHDLNELKLIKQLMETNLFFDYIRNTTKDYASGYISMSRNYIKNFGVYQFNKKEKLSFLKSKNRDRFLKKLYQVSDL